MPGRFVTEEPVRGGYPPPRFYSLSGLEQVRAVAQGLVPRHPLWRLFGIRLTHATSGGATLTMRASPWLQSSAGHVSIVPLISAAAVYTCRTVAPAGIAGLMRQLSLSYFRIPTVDMESFVARGRVITSGASRVTAEVHVEDAQGRLVAHATSQYVLFEDERAGAPAAPLDRVDEPAYPTPDPTERPLDTPPEGALFGQAFLDRAREAIAEGDVRHNPFLLLSGIRPVDVDEGTAVLAITASEWLCNEARDDLGAVPPLASANGAWAAASVIPEGRGVINNTFTLTLVGGRPVPPDGRELISRGKVVHLGDDEIVVDTEAFDADGYRLALARSVWSLVERRDATTTRPADRVLATVVFADVVDSTPAVQRMGDAGWRETLERVYAAMRKELQTFRGTEVSTTGDGVLATFDSPARAVQCSRALRDRARQLGLQTRIGIHLGEIERVGRDIAGIAVHVAKRVEGAADPDAILVTSTVRDTAAGSGIRFASRGMHALKGLEDEWHLFSVED